MPHCSVDTTTLHTPSVPVFFHAARAKEDTSLQVQTDMPGLWNRGRQPQPARHRLPHEYQRGSGGGGGFLPVSPRVRGRCGTVRDACPGPLLKHDPGGAHPRHAAGPALLARAGSGGTPLGAQDLRGGSSWADRRRTVRL